jgi:FAD/FMN-containing dehydrogenase
LIDKRPALIVRAAGVADVIAAIKLARERQLLLAVRGGGHNVAGHGVCDRGMVLDLSDMRSVRVDPQTRVARVEGGATLRDLDRETQLHGLAAPVGVVSATGVGGLTLGGGYGWLTRKRGLSIDNLLSAEVVTADGRLRKASPAEHPDLFWAIRGGGGNFGVVTQFEFRLHPVGPLVTSAIPFYPATNAADALRFFREYMATAPEEVFALAEFWSLPDGPAFPADRVGEPVIVFIGVHTGPLEEGERSLRPLREFDSPIVDLSGQLPWTEMQQFYDDDYPDGMRYYWKSVYLEELDDAVIDVLVAHSVQRPSALSNVDVWYLGGAFGRVDPDETAFGSRDARVMIGVEANWRSPHEDEANITWARDAIDALRPLSSGRSYVNFGGFAEESERLVQEVYRQNVRRLAQIKAGYDPDNLFRVNPNIAPAHVR